MFFNHFLIWVELDNLFDNTFFDIIPCFIIDNFEIFWNLQNLQKIYNFDKYLFIQSTDMSVHLFLNQTEIFPFFKNLENVHSIYHYSIPNTKLFYPEPFVAAPSFMHSDLWFVHILVYQYWLWFVFIFIIVFFIITFLCIVRWCNMRIKPRRETRGVSRSKCGDLITAIVPVSWAASIIISESTDAIDYFDGFGTTEMVIGIRAYQWGWEYYYPKDADLNYNLKKNYSSFFGKSLKYEKTSDINLTKTSIWRYYQNKPFDQIITSAHLLLLPTDNHKILNFLNFSDVGTNVFHESNLFKHTKTLSKTLFSNLIVLPSLFSLKYSQLSQLFISDYNIFETYSYGSKRQQNFTNLKSVTNNFTTLFNLRSVNKLYSFTFQKSLNFTTSFTGFYLPNMLKHQFLKQSSSTLLQHNVIVQKYISDLSLKINKLFIFSSLFEKINNNSDKKKIKYSVLKLLTLNSKKSFLHDRSNYNSNLFFNNNIVNIFSKSSNFFDNKRFTKLFFTSSSSNQVITKGQQTSKILANISVKKGNFNLENKTNSLFMYSDKLQNDLVWNSRNFIFAKNFKWLDFMLANKLLANRSYFDMMTPALFSNSVKQSLLNYDDYESSDNEDQFVNVQNRDELIPEYTTKAYWNLYYAHTDVNWRITNSYFYNKLHFAFYIPFFTLGYGYDFLNWQSFSLLEDSYWENINSVYSIDDYSNASYMFAKTLSFNKKIRFFNREDREFFPFKNLLSKPFLADKFAPKQFYVSSPFVEETISSPSLMNTWQFVIFPSLTNLSFIDESFDFFTMQRSILFKNNVNVLTFLINNISFNSHYFVCDSLRSSIEDFSWFYDYKLNSEFSQSFSDFLYFYNSINKIVNKQWNILNALKVNILFKNITYEISKLIDFKEYQLSFFKNIRYSNYLYLRLSSRTGIGDYNAYQKVFKPRFDENRSHAKFADIANLHINLLNISAPRAKFERMLGKNREEFSKITLFKNDKLLNFNYLYDAFSSLNFYFFDYPFLISLKSDASRYFWTDWFSKWGMAEVQPASASKYTLSGMPHFNKAFQYSGNINSELVDTETYFTRLSRARKNYMPNWIHTPYINKKNSIFLKNNFIFDLFNQSIKSIIISHILFDSISWYWNNLSVNTLINYNFCVSNSNLNSYARSAWIYSSTIASYFYTTTNLIDVLTKREYIYREFLFSKKKLINLADYTTNNFNNVLIKDIKSVFLMNTPTNFNTEFSRSLYYDTFRLYNITIFQPIYLSTLSFFGLPLSIAHLLMNKNYDNLFIEKFNSSELIKSQYRPLRKGITNMIRLHGTGAIAMPIEIRLQILASSKDVIHSWSIPSAGVKIDCVPGYSSHRVLIFLVSGIFWGQCMEVCGRYHHWMPIIVYFMKRDLFFLWCTHFVFMSGNNNILSFNDRQYTNFSKTVSFNKSNWIAEIK